ncbi:DNA-directed RNA polymerase subunit alpha [bacterium]|nr:DNA-directed RNA polymerase subunit alpha [bacterium]
MTMNWSLLTLPKGYRIEENKNEEGYIRFSIEPLMRGYGNTIGNALRRVLLSSMEGSAVYGYTLEGFQHALDSTEGIYQDATEIIMNLKTINLTTDEKELEININKQGPCVITGKDLEDNNSFLTVINKDQVILEVTGKEKVDLNVYIKKGIGFELSDSMSLENKPVNFIAVDALFSPILKINYNVDEDIRVGTIRNFEKLTLEVWHNRTQNAEVFIPFSAKILKDIFTTLVDFEEDEPVKDVKGKKEEEENQYLAESIEVLDLSKRPLNCLVSSKITKIKQLVSMSRDELMKMKNLGSKSLKEIEKRLEEKKLYLGMQFKKR